MFLLVSLVLIMVALAAASDEPIVHLRGKCPPLAQNDPSLHLTADVPAYAMALCRNGKKELTASDEVNFSLGGSFDQSYTGTSCQFYKKKGSNTYTVDVEVGWGEPSSQVVQQRKIKTISCAYDDHGRAVSSTETITDYFLNPWEQQHLLGDNATAVFNLQVWDVLDNEIKTDYICIGRKIRLVAYDIKGIPGFRALSCLVRNKFGSYYVLRAGCGDGLVFPKTSGFDTQGNCVYSPYFNTFKLNGDDNTVQFECVYTTCDRNCDGSSCPVESGPPVTKKGKRSASGAQQYVVARSGTLQFKLS